MIWLLRFFRATDAMPMWMGVTSVALGGYCALIVALDARSADEALAVLLLWQMICASAGFARRAGAGHFDPALVAHSRARVAAAHGINAILPGAILWLTVSGVDAAVHRTAPAAFEAGRLSAYMFVSAATWSMSLGGPRLIGGALWLVLIVAGATTRFGAEQYAAMLARADGTAAEIAHAAALTLLCPFLMFGDHLPSRTAVAVILAMAACGACAAGLIQIRRRDYPLEPSS